MRKAVILLLSLLLICAALANIVGCGCNGEQDQGTERTGEVIVPDVIGLSVEDARETLEANDLDWSAREEKVTDRSEDGRVLSQDPEAGTMLTPDMTVYLDVGKL